MPYQSLPHFNRNVTTPNVLPFASLLILLTIPQFIFHLFLPEKTPASERWVGGFQITGEIILGTLVFSDENQEGFFQEFNRSLPTTVQDLEIRGDGIRFHIRYANRDLTFAGMVSQGIAHGRVEAYPDGGHFFFARSATGSTQALDVYIGSYETTSGARMLITRADDPDTWFYLQNARQVRLYPLQRGGFFSQIGQHLIFDQDAAHDLSVQAILNFPLGDPVPYNRSEPFETHSAHFSNDGVQLYGDLFLPQGSGPFPAVVLLHGVGARERYFYRVFADTFARYGLAALIFDQRGAGKSSGEQTDTSLTTLASDAAAALDYLHSHPLINPDNIGVWGFSQGGRVAPMAVTSTDGAAFVIAVSTPGMSTVALTLWEYEADLGQIGAPSWLASALLKIQRSYLYELERDLDQGPLAYWREVTCPVLLVYGEEDRQLPPWVSAARIQTALSASGFKPEVLMLESADHDLMMPTVDGVFAYKEDARGVMAAWASDNGLEVGNIKAERLNQISDTEGIAFEPGGEYGPPVGMARKGVQLTWIFLTAFGFILSWVGLINKQLRSAVPEYTNGIQQIIGFSIGAGLVCASGWIGLLILGGRVYAPTIIFSASTESMLLWAFVIFSTPLISVLTSATALVLDRRAHRRRKRADAGHWTALGLTAAISCLMWWVQWVWS